MRWQDLFADLEAQLRHAQHRERAAEISDRTRSERAEVRWSDRLAACLGAELTIGTTAGPLTGRLEDLGRDWCLLTGSATTLVPFSAVTSLVGVGAGADTAQELGRRFGIAVALRAISRDRATVELRLHGEDAVATGTIDVVGADYLQLAEHPVDLPRRPESITGERLVPFSGLSWVRRR